MQIKQDVYKTTDFYLAVTLSIFCDLQDINWLDHKQAEFVFDSNDKTNALANDYWNGILTVDPLKFSQQIRLLKARLEARR